MRTSFGKKEEYWGTYRKVIRKLYKSEVKDKNVLFDQVMEFARETKYRDALVKAERDTSAKRYDGVRKRIAEAKAWLGSSPGKRSPSQLCTVENGCPFFIQLVAYHTVCARKRRRCGR